MWPVLAVDETSGSSHWLSTRYIARNFGSGVEVTYNSPRTTLSANLTIIWALTRLQNMNYISGHSEWLRLHERTALSRREDSLRLPRARHSRDHLGTDSVPSKLLPLCVPVSPSPVLREASRDLRRSIGLRRWSCLNCERRCQRIHRVRKYNGRF